VKPSFVVGRQSLAKSYRTTDFGDGTLTGIANG